MNKLNWTAWWKQGFIATSLEPYSWCRVKILRRIWLHFMTHGHTKQSKAWACFTATNGTWEHMDELNVNHITHGLVHFNQRLPSSLHDFQPFLHLSSVILCVLFSCTHRSTWKLMLILEWISHLTLHNCFDCKWIAFPAHVASLFALGFLVVWLSLVGCIDQYCGACVHQVNYSKIDGCY